MFKVNVTNQCFLLDTFRYTQDKILNAAIYWKCKNCSCPGRAVEYGSNPSSMKKPQNHDDDEMICKVEEFRTNLKRRIEDPPQPMKRIDREQPISLYTTSPQMTSMFHEIKNSLYQTRKQRRNKPIETNFFRPVGLEILSIFPELMVNFLQKSKVEIL